MADYFKFQFNKVKTEKANGYVGGGQTSNTKIYCKVN